LCLVDGIRIVRRRRESQWGRRVMNSALGKGVRCNTNVGLEKEVPGGSHWVDKGLRQLGRPTPHVAPGIQPHEEGPLHVVHIAVPHLLQDLCHATTTEAEGAVAVDGPIAIGQKRGELIKCAFLVCPDGAPEVGDRILLQ
jgi:hypothetical protein